jgi:hypothetical protein
LSGARDVQYQADNAVRVDFVPNFDRPASALISHFEGGRFSR